MSDEDKISATEAQDLFSLRYEKGEWCTSCWPDRIRNARVGWEPREKGLLFTTPRMVLSGGGGGGGGFGLWLGK